jgi:hypothetical protein
MAAGIARYRGKPLAEHVYDFALALVAPLGAQYYSRLCSHCFPVLESIDAASDLPEMPRWLWRMERAHAAAGLKKTKAQTARPAPFSMINPAVGLPGLSHLFQQRV